MFPEAPLQCDSFLAFPCFENLDLFERYWSCIFQMSLYWNLSGVFLVIRLWLLDLGEGDHRGKVSFSSHHTKSISKLKKMSAWNLFALLSLVLPSVFPILVSGLIIHRVMKTWICISSFFSIFHPTNRQLLRCYCPSSFVFFPSPIHTVTGQVCIVFSTHCSMIP